MAGGTPGFIELYVVFVHLLILSTAHQNQDSRQLWAGEIKGVEEVLSQVIVVNRAGRLKPKTIKQMLI